jgi:hypothetical protein
MVLHTAGAPVMVIVYVPIGKTTFVPAVGTVPVDQFPGIFQSPLEVIHVACPQALVLIAKKQTTGKITARKQVNIFFELLY